jgi:hypothetical protein
MIKTNLINFTNRFFRVMLKFMKLVMLLKQFVALMDRFDNTYQNNSLSFVSVRYAIPPNQAEKNMSRR